MIFEIKHSLKLTYATNKEGIDFIRVTKNGEHPLYSWFPGSGLIRNGDDPEWLTSEYQYSLGHRCLELYVHTALNNAMDKLEREAISKEWDVETVIGQVRKLFGGDA
jgi:hypothetical protein